MSLLDYRVPILKVYRFSPPGKRIWLQKKKLCEKLEEHSKELPQLYEWNIVFIQNQNSAQRKPNNMVIEGIVIQAGKYDQYLVHVHNHRFLLKFLQSRDPEYLEETNLPPLRSSVKDCPSKVTQADDSKSSIYFDYSNKDNFQRDVNFAPDLSFELPNGEGQNDIRDVDY